VSAEIKWPSLRTLFFQVFDVVLNGDLTIASDLDIFERVGRGVAFDEYVEFEVKDGKILYEGDESEITAGKMRVEFIKVSRKLKKMAPRTFPERNNPARRNPESQK